MSNMAIDVFARTLALASLGNGGGGSAVDTYTKAEIDKMFGEAGTVQVEAVDVLPTEDIKENVIYLVPNGSTGENYYNECMYINEKWEIIGTTEIDLSSYATKEELEEAISTELKEYVTKTDLSEALKNYATREDLPIYTLEDLVEGEQFKFYQTPNNNKTGDIYAAITVKMIGLKKGIFIPYYNGKLYYNVMFRYDTCNHNGYNPSAAGGFYIILRDIAGNEAVQTDLAVGWNENYSGASIYYLDNSSGFISNRYLGVQFSTFARKTDLNSYALKTDIPSIEGLATEEYADAAGQKAFDDMAAVTGDINSLTTETHETFVAAINEINDKVNNIEIPSADLSKYATKQDVQDAVYEIDEDRDMKKYFVTDYGVYNIFTLDFMVDEETYYTIDSELGMAIQDIMNDFAANSGHESSCVIIINDIYRNAFKLYVNRPGMSLTTISPVEFLEDGYVHRIECADVNIFNNEAKFSDVGYILKTSQTKLSADVDLTGYATETYVNEAVANATGNVNVFEGTQEEYDALSDEEKAKYTIVVIDDGEEV